MDWVFLIFFVVSINVIISVFICQWVILKKELAIMERVKMRLAKWMIDEGFSIHEDTDTIEDLLKELSRQIRLFRKKGRYKWSHL